MLQVKPMPAQIAPERLARLAQVDPATVRHFRDWGFVDPEMRPVMIVETSLPMQEREPRTLERLRSGEKLPAISGTKAKIDAARAAQSRPKG